MEYGATGGIVSGLFDFIGGIGKYAMTKKLAEEQEERAEKLRGQAGQVKAPALQQEYLQAQRLAALRAITGIPDYGIMEERMRQNTANTLAAIRGGASSGAEYSYLAGAAMNRENAMRSELQMRQSAYKADAAERYANTLWNIGAAKDRNEAIRRNRANELYRQASALENAATANRYQGKINLVDDISSAVGTITGSIGGLKNNTDSSANNISGNKANESAYSLYDYIGKSALENKATANEATESDDPEFDNIVIELIGKNNLTLDEAVIAAERILGRKRNQ